MLQNELLQMGILWWKTQNMRCRILNQAQDITHDMWQNHEGRSHEAIAIYISNQVMAFFLHFSLLFSKLFLIPYLQKSTTTPATRATRSPTTTASTAAARGQMPASWTHAAPSLNGTLLWNAAQRTKEDLANTISALISLKVCNSINFSDQKLDKILGIMKFQKSLCFDASLILFWLQTAVSK